MTHKIECLLTISMKNLSILVFQVLNTLVRNRSLNRLVQKLV